jgi:hypothetical protein
MLRLSSLRGPKLTYLPRYLVGPANVFRSRCAQYVTARDNRLPKSF